MRRRGTAGRMIATVVGVLSMIIAGAALAIRYAPLPTQPLVFASVAAPFLAIAAPVALVVLSLARRWALSAVAAILTVITIAVQVPLYVADPPPESSVTVRVMTINMLYGRANAASIVATASRQADVLMVQELTPEALRRLQQAGVDRAFPHHAIEPRPMAAGAGIFSRHPISGSAPISGLQRAMVTTRLEIDGVRTDPIVAAVHLDSPWPRPIEGWHRDFDAFPGVLTTLAAQAGGGSVIIAGDFNATVDMRPFRRLLKDGYRDASEQAGAGRQFTFPSNRRFPPVMGLDHVLTRNATGVSTATITIPGTDHRALVATVLVPRG
ncbi:endonuclease/exonuclease/phosphatase family protein [Mycolicibacterium arabiense]|nr:endonuclease/exonuclease/phosphatase family protein [Mycolicibacterium arabiense]MCV7374149.1 endonuclease/exonuclease/phosphatase family protein [Mycolicibacterium arabiense]